VIAPAIAVRGGRRLTRRRAAGTRLLIALLTAGLALGFADRAAASETFGVEAFESKVVNRDGSPAVQAGSHPYAMTTAITFNHVVTATEEGQPPRVRTYGDPKDIELNLPRGLILDPRATSIDCTEAELEGPEGPAGCPDAAAVGVASIYLDGAEVLDEPVYNMSPPADVPAELGFDAAGIGLIMHIGGEVRAGAEGSDEGLSADISEIPQEHPIYAIELTLWGDPSEAAHDGERGLCAAQEAKQQLVETELAGSCPVARVGTPLLTLPASCTGEPFSTAVSVDSWQEPGKLVEPSPSQSAAMTGCEHLDFSPKLAVSTSEPEDASAESPSGLSVELKMPLQESANGLAEAEVKRATLTLPTGMAVSPAAAGGREACAPMQIALGSQQAPTCPDASKVGAATIDTPLLADPLEGSIYLAQQGSGPFNSLLGLYLVVDGDGVLIKLPGKVEADQRTGQLTVTFGNLPQLPFSELKLSFFGGPRAILVTPPDCGSFAADSSLTPWSGTPVVSRSANLQIASGPNGGACPSGSFSPSFTAGTTDNRAGVFSAFSMTLSRQDGEQRFAAFSVQLPPGLSGILQNVARCPEPQASLGECSQASAIGTTTVGVGPGGDPFYLPEQGQQTSKVYLTGPYGGAPFGLSIVVSGIAGPFDLGTLVIRAKLAVDPHTAQLTIASDPGVGGMPVIEDGIPLDIRTLNITIDRAGFIFNPTSCAPQAVSGTVSSIDGSRAVVSSPFQVANCAELPFKPKLTALTQATTSRADGAYLHVKVVSGPGQANIGKVKVDFPKQLPSRLATLQQACMARVFETDPAACPVASVVGTGTVNTPMLAHSLIGPAYLVSHGVVASPALVMVLQGEGITLDFEGQTNIVKGITSSTFRSLPDTPISTFDLVFPKGPHSAFAVDLPKKAKRGLCSQTLKMPTAITGQNGAQVKQVIRIAVSGCLEHKQVKKQAVRHAKKKTKKKAEWRG
jgi:hypothetical protein